MTPRRVLICEDEPLARETLRDFIAAHGELLLVGEAADGLTALKLARALAALTSKKPLVGAVIDLFDQGFTLQVLSGAVMRLPIWEVLAGGTSSTQIATYLLTTVNGQTPDATALAAAVSSLDHDPQGDFLWHLAQTAGNQLQIDLVGLADRGLEFV